MINLSQVILVIAILTCVRGALQNFTLDDTNGDPFGNKSAYIGVKGDSGWNHGPDSPGGLKPDASRVINGTWHDATYTPGDADIKAVEITFIGAYIAFLLQETTALTI